MEREAMRRRVQRGRRAAALVILAGWSTFVGCAAPPPPVDHHYRLAVESPPALEVPPLEGRLEVARLRAESIAQGRQIAYRSTDRPNEIRLYAYHHWVDPLPLMIQGVLGQTLREAGVADEVSIPAFRLDRDYVLYGRIVAFEQVLEGATSRGQVEIELSLVREADESLLLQRTYREEIGAASQDINDTVRALSLGLSRVIERLSNDLGARARPVRSSR
jgi:ABC-type uncharacterized transport system auxiliary subunit